MHKQPDGEQCECPLCSLGRDPEVERATFAFIKAVDTLTDDEVREYAKGVGAVVIVMGTLMHMGLSPMVLSSDKDDIFLVLGDMMRASGLGSEHCKKMQEISRKVTDRQTQILQRSN